MKIVLEIDEVCELVWNHVKRKRLLGDVDYNKLWTHLEMDDIGPTGGVIAEIQKEPEVTK